VFVDEILTQIQPLSLGQLSKATGLSRSYCLEVRKGIYAPHLRRWEAFRIAAVLSPGAK
jgi:hypothetical protein